MQKRVLALLWMGTLTLACGGSDAHKRVEEVPIDENLKRPTDLPPDEVGGPGSTQTTSSTTGVPDHGPPPGVGPQSLDSPDAGASASGGGDAGGPTLTFQQQPGGLSEKECTDVVMKYAKLMTREHHGTPTPSASAIGQHAVYGQMIVECGKGATKKQHKCGMGSHTTAAWKKCME